MVSRRGEAAHGSPGAVDAFRESAEQRDSRMGLQEGELLAEAFGPRAVVRIEPRQVGCARRRDRRVEGRYDALGRLMENADTVVGGSETGEHCRGSVIRPVVDDHAFEIAEILGLDARDRFRQPRRTIAHRHDDRDGGDTRHPFFPRNAAPTSPANLRNCHTPASPTNPMAQNAKWKSAAPTCASPGCVSVAARSMMAPPATPSAFPICCNMLNSVLALLMRGWSRSQKLNAAMVVNSIDRVRPLRKSTTTMTAAGVAAVSKPQVEIIAMARTPFQIKVRRKPNLPSTALVAGFM